MIPMQAWLLGDRDDLRELVGPWMRLSTQCRPKLGLPLPIPKSKLRDIPVPVLVSLGTNDPILGTPGPMLARAREIPNVTIEVLQDAGHALIVEAPEQMNDLLTGFLH
jgi:pimeloyl-ACP methyl ester carboxylesterase